MAVKQKAGIDLLPAYRQGRSAIDAGVFKLSSNENPYPPLPSVTAVLSGLLDRIHLYPDMAAPEIEARVAQRYDVPASALSFGAGSVEVAAQLVNATAGPGDEVIFAWRSFEAYPILVQIAGATAVPVPLAADERHDLPAMAAAITDKTRLIFVCNPNNPTGGVVTADQLHAFMTHVPSDVLVVIDEAYLHFNRRADTALGIEFFRTYPNVAVLHTFSKAYGLAGLRIGYAIAPDEVAANLRRVKVPFGVTDLAQHAAIASLDAEAELTERIDRISAERDRLHAGLQQQGWPIHESQGNFVWLRTGESTARVTEILDGHGVLVRSFPGEGIRVTVGGPEANDQVLSATEAARSALS